MIESNIESSIESNFKTNIESSVKLPLSAEFGDEIFVYFKTFGCRSNYFDTQVMKESLQNTENPPQNTPQIQSKEIQSNSPQISTQSVKKSRFVLCEHLECADIVVVNSCCVTNAAEAGVRAFIEKMRREGKCVVLAGCGVENLALPLLEKGSILGAFGHSHKQNLEQILQNLLNLNSAKFSANATNITNSAPHENSKDSILHEDSIKNSDSIKTSQNSAKAAIWHDSKDSIDNAILRDFSGKSRAFLKIQEGCNFTCSYCIIPQVRGAARSLSADQILAQVESLGAAGYSEFILSGTNLGSWRGENTQSHIESKNTANSADSIAQKDSIKKIQDLADLIVAICALNCVKRLRLGSLEPSQITNKFLEILEQENVAQKLEKHLHIALQHTSPKMLEIMNRKNQTKNDLALFSKLKQKGFALGTDFIVAHPGESEEIWQEALENFKKLPLTHLHSFIFSVRKGTHSADLVNILERVDPKIAKERKEQITQIVAQNNYIFRANLAKNAVRLIVFIESKKGDFFVGFDQFYNEVFVKSQKDLINKWLFIAQFVAQKEGNYAEA